MKILRYLVFYTGKFTNQSGHPQKDGKIRLHKCTGKSIAQIKKKSSKTNLACFEKIGYGIEKHTANENMGEKKMADGFLAPTGKFYPKTENFHAQTARAILGPDGQTDEPIQELFAPRLYFICRIPTNQANRKISMPIWITSSADRGIRRPKGRRPGLQNIRKSCRESSSLTSTTTRQTLRTFYISNVRMFPWCKGCAEEKARDLWGNAQSEEKPKRCDACPAFRNRPL